MDKNEEYILGRIIWKGKKYSLPSRYAFFFNDLPSDKKESLLGQINIETSGSPGILFTTPTNEWTLVCSRQVLSSKDDKVTAIELTEIEKITSNQMDNLRNGEKMVDPKYQKSEWNELAVYDRTGNKHVLNADKGSDLFTLWNILLMVVRLR
jgi:hypothetical protein